ncbi:MAG TPA: GNAT family N-acetyltransferase, partial [Betaproteobacteria bacterium]|nr:GNAT family N-acetyltransferase [Betaproteobacteria bacterium]
MNNVKFDIVNSLSGIKAEDWNSLNGDSLVTSYDFLSALEDTENVGGNSGWSPAHLIATDGDKLVGAAPLYIKTHSYGEFIFDWAWADAYHRSGLDYYPKLVSAVPFTPATGPRLLASDPEMKHSLASATLAFAQDNKLSSFHCLYPELDDLQIWGHAGCLMRKSIQFHWTNQDYENFEHFLSFMKSAKRKKIKQER